MDGGLLRYDENLISALLITLICYFIAAESLLVRRAKALWQRLAPQLHLTNEERQSIHNSIGKVPVRLWLFMVIISTLIAVAAPYLEGRGIDNWNPWDLTTQAGGAIWHRFFSLLVALGAAGTIAVALTESLRLTRMIEKSQDFDPLRGGSLAPFTRMGLDNALVAMGFAALYSPFLIDPAYYLPIAIIFFMMFVVSMVGLILPVRGVRRRIADEKTRELERIYQVIAAERKRLTALKADDAEAPKRLKDLNLLMELAERVEAIREWPFNRSDFSRYGLYLLIPLASWVGAALVEVFVDGLMG